MSKYRVGIMGCSECEKMNKAMDVYNTFAWGSVGIGYDNETNEILINEAQLMRIIQMINTCQQPRKIRLIDQKDMFKRGEGK